MNVKVHELMTERVLAAEPHQTVAHVRGMMEHNHVHALPVLDSEGRPVGIVSTADVAGGDRDGSPVSSVMTTKVYTVSRTDGPHVAARIMRNHRIRHVVVTDEQKVVGILSAFDLLALVEDHRFALKNPPTPKKGSGKRR